VQGRDEAPELCPHAHRVVHGRARAACADRKALRQPGSHVGRSHREHLLLRPHVLAMLAGERARSEDLVGEADEEDSERRRQEQQCVTATWNRYVQVRDAARDAPGHRDAPLLEVEPPGSPDRADDD
jgi:hypothetical protein